MMGRMIVRGHRLILSLQHRKEWMRGDRKRWHRCLIRRCMWYKRGSMPLGKSSFCRALQRHCVYNCHSMNSTEFTMVLIPHVKFLSGTVEDCRLIASTEADCIKSTWLLRPQFRDCKSFHHLRWGSDGERSTAVAWVERRELFIWPCCGVDIDVALCREDVRSVPGGRTYC